MVRIHFVNEKCVEGRKRKIVKKKYAPGTFTEFKKTRHMESKLEMEVN